MRTFLSIPSQVQANSPEAPLQTQDQTQQPSIPLTPKILLKVAADSADDGGKKKRTSQYDSGAEMRQLYKSPLKYDNNKSSVDIVKSVAQKTGVDPSFLYSSAFQEGMNKAIADPDGVSEAYNKAKIDGAYPVDGFYNYGLDTFGDRFSNLVKKGYLTSEFASRFKTYSAKNETENVNTAAFKTNEDALMAKAAVLKDEMDKVSVLAKSKGIELDDKAKKYFTLASYNSRSENLPIMMEEYAKAKDKNAFIDKGLTSRGGVHRNIAPRMQNMSVASEFFK